MDDGSYARVIAPPCAKIRLCGPFPLLGSLAAAIQAGIGNVVAGAAAGAGLARK